MPIVGIRRIHQDHTCPASLTFSRPSQSGWNVMNDKYEPCSRGSGKKFKFCCYEKREPLRGVSAEALARRAAEFPVDQCFISRHWKERGIAQVLVVRQLLDGMSLMGVYLVDVFCLGI